MSDKDEIAEIAEHPHIRNLDSQLSKNGENDNLMEQDYEGDKEMDGKVILTNAE